MVVHNISGENALHNAIVDVDLPTKQNQGRNGRQRIEAILGQYKLV